MKSTPDHIVVARKICRHSTLAEAGPALGISSGRARQILAQDARNQGLPKWTRGQDIRTARILLSEGFNSKHTVQAAIERGERIHHIGP